jgi:hypothetical protein
MIRDEFIASLPADLRTEWNERSIGICPADGASLNFFEIIEESEKSVKVHSKEISKFPAWIPLAALEIKPVGTMHVLKLKKWFVRKLWDDGKPYQRVALGLSVW